MLSRESIESVLRQMNEAENSRPQSTVEETIARIDAVMAGDVQGWANGVHVPNRAAERDRERVIFGRMADYHREFDLMLVDPPRACVRWTVRGTVQGMEIVASAVSILELNEDGLVRRYWMHFDPAAFVPR